MPRGKNPENETHRLSLSSYSPNPYGTNCFLKLHDTIMFRAKRVCKVQKDEVISHAPDKLLARPHRNLVVTETG